MSVPLAKQVRGDGAEAALHHVEVHVVVRQLEQVLYWGYKLRVQEEGELGLSVPRAGFGVWD
jgi:hypothetical protein